MQRKILNTKKIRSGFYIQNGLEKLHSIPILNTGKNSSNKYMKNNVLYSISCVAALLLAAIIDLSISRVASAVICGPMYCTGTISDQGTISPVTGSPTTPPTASLSLSKTSLKSDATMPGSTATVSTSVTVNVSDAKSYSLTLSIKDSADIKVEGGNTVLKAGTVTTDNTWGYKWDNASSYTAPSTTAQTLTTPALDNNAREFTKTLTFGAKFANNADAGHYKANGTLSLVATPKDAIYTMANLKEMQQLAAGYAPDACANTVIPTGKDYAGPYTLKDVRDGNTYTVYKFKDGKCWMTENLKLSNVINADGFYYESGRILNSTTSDISTSTWTLPASNQSGFSDNTASNAYLSGNTGYYTWCAATAGTCASATSQGANAPSSICPKGWKLPVGYQSTKTNNDFWNLFRNMGLTISNDSLASTSGGYTNWGSGDLAKAQGSPYNFAYTGVVNAGTFYDPSSNPRGYWWSRTANGSTGAYNLYIDSSDVNPGTGSSRRRSGYAVRCVAQ